MEASHKPQKCARGKFRSSPSKGLDEHFPDVSHPRSVASSNGCLSLLKKRSSGEKDFYFSVCMLVCLFLGVGWAEGMLSNLSVSSGTL